MINIQQRFRSLFSSANIKVIIAEDPKYKIGNTNLLWDFFYDPPHPDDWVHTLQIDRLMPAFYWDMNKTIFALVNGKRTKDQLCLSNPETFDIVQDKLRIRMRSSPKTKYWSVSQGDNPEWCTCSKCAGQRPSDILITFVNKIAAKFPDKIISTLAYFKTQPPPSVIPLRNVQVMLTTIQLPKDKNLRTNTRNDVVDWRGYLNGWLKLTKNILIWHYCTNFKNEVAPNPTLYSIIPDLMWWKSLGIKDYIIQTNHAPGHEFTDIKSMMIDRTLTRSPWFSRLALNRIITEYYGPSAPFVKKYIALLHKRARSVRSIINWWDLDEYKHTFLSEKSLDSYYEALAGSLHVCTTVEQKNRVRDVYFQLWYADIGLYHDESVVEEFIDNVTRHGKVTVNEHNLLALDWLKKQL